MLAPEEKEVVKNFEGIHYGNSVGDKLTNSQKPKIAQKEKNSVHFSRQLNQKKMW